MAGSWRSQRRTPNGLKMLNLPTRHARNPRFYWVWIPAMTWFLMAGSWRELFPAVMRERLGKSHGGKGPAMSYSPRRAHGGMTGTRREFQLQRLEQVHQKRLSAPAD
jgi:hypothetical protein